MILFRTLLTMNPCGFPSFRFFCAYSRVFVDDEAVRVNAKNLKRLGISVEIISQATGLSMAEIEQL